MPDETQYSLRDHDLLITLHTKFDTFLQTTHPELTRKMESVLLALEHKASKKDIESISVIVQNHGLRIDALENESRAKRDRREGIVAVMQRSWKVWLGISAVIYFIIAIYNQLPK